MSRRWRSLLVRGTTLVTCATLLSPTHAVPARAAPRAEPVRLADSGLSISVPSGPVSLGTGGAGTSFTASLGTVTVTAPVGATTWTASVALTSSFRVQQSGQEWVLPNDRVTYSVTGLSSVLTALLGSCSVTPSQTLVQTREVARCARPLVLGGVAGSVSWSPRLTVQTQPTDPAGTYTGTITHSVA